MNDSGDALTPEVQAAHEQAVRAGADGYIDPASDLFVFTAAYLSERGTCCDSGCRHCPYKARPHHED